MTAAPKFDIPGVWTGERRLAAVRTEHTGLRELDVALRGGWPAGSLIQIVAPQSGLGFSLIVPLLAEMTRLRRYVALIGTPFMPYAPALSSRNIDLNYLTWLQPSSVDDALWSMEQATRSSLFASVAYWGPAIDGTSERRLQLAADSGNAIAFHFSDCRRDSHSYAAVRLLVTPADAGLELEVLKCRGTHPGRKLRYRCVDLPADSQAA